MEDQLPIASKALLLLGSTLPQASSSILHQANPPLPHQLSDRQGNNNSPRVLAATLEPLPNSSSSSHRSSTKEARPHRVMVAHQEETTTSKPADPEDQGACTLVLLETCLPHSNHSKRKGLAFLQNSKECFHEKINLKVPNDQLGQDHILPTARGCCPLPPGLEQGLPSHSNSNQEGSTSSSSPTQILMQGPVVLYALLLLNNKANRTKKRVLDSSVS
mmetsp:Transcript_38926/g.49162  ORF Transcript_38926/g.49162 Transcript_38926/m.49162 type:complete len:218 (-) Transcript_38926:1541-2194(-)